jgi:hypothetical protein
VGGERAEMARLLDVKRINQPGNQARIISQPSG